jgi:hypothetical protein
MKIGYARVSTDDRNPALLLYEIIAISCFRLKRRCVPLGRYKGEGRVSSDVCHVPARQTSSCG